MIIKLLSGESYKQALVIGGLAFIASFISSIIALAENEIKVEAAIPTSDEVYKRVYGGWRWWHVYCYRCHGLDALGSALASNLRDSIKLLSYDEFLQTVREGRPTKGMQAWSVLLDDKQITDIYIYVMARSDQVLPAGRPDEVGENETPWIPPVNWPTEPFPVPNPESPAEVNETVSTEPI